MNAHDKGNLEFLLSLGEQGLANWYNQASDDDVQYAAELLDQYEQELDEFLVEQSGYSDAARLISRIMH